MPQMVLQRNYLLSSILGHSISFEKGVPIGVPPKLVPAALQIGAELVKSEDKEDFLPPENTVVGAPDGDERETCIFEGFRQLEENYQTDPKKGAEDFNASGKPKFKALSSIVGFKVDAQETTDLWARYQEMKAALKGY